MQPDPILPADAKIEISLTDFTHFNMKSVIWEAWKDGVISNGYSHVVFIVDRVEHREIRRVNTTHLMQVLILAVRPIDNDGETPLGWMRVDD